MMNNPTSVSQAVQSAAALLAEADSVLVTAGACMGIDSGLPDFRGVNGFWNAYPALGTLGIAFTSIANPKAFARHPTLAWGFYGHRLQLYRDTVPPAGFQRLQRLASQLPHGMRFFTSNVDGQFQKAGFDPDHVTECHGSIHQLQCFDGCPQQPWSAGAFAPVVDTQACLLLSPLPTCAQCGGLARPNILMFGDGDFQDRHYAIREGRLHAWLGRATRTVIIEIGAGTAIPSARDYGEATGCPLIRINPAESQVGRGQDIDLPLGALEALLRITDTLWGTAGAGTHR